MKQVFRPRYEDEVDLRNWPGVILKTNETYEKQRPANPQRRKRDNNKKRTGTVYRLDDGEFGWGDCGFNF